MSRTFFSLRRRRGFGSRHPALTVEDARVVSCSWVIPWFVRPGADSAFRKTRPSRPFREPPKAASPLLKFHLLNLHVAQESASAAAVSETLPLELHRRYDLRLAD